MELLFERFLSEERGEWPDIDLDLPSGDEREKAIQYVYQRYGERGAAMTANVCTYTLRRMLLKAREAKFLARVPEFRLFKEEGRSLRLDDEAESRLLLVAEQPPGDIIVIMRDTGMRNARELYRMRIENLDFANCIIFNPNSKTQKGRRFIPMSERVKDILKTRCAGRREGWAFQSRYKGKHIGAALVNRQWVKGPQSRARKYGARSRAPLFHLTA